MRSPKDEFPGQVDLSDPTGYPEGKAQNIVTSGDGTGTPNNKLWVNDVFGFFQAALAAAGASPSGANEKVGASQILDALHATASKGRLVKFLTASSTLTINEGADDSVSAYLTSNEIKSGTYLVYAYGGGGGGGDGDDQGTGGGGGGTDRAVLAISGSTAYVIGAGGAPNVAGGNTTMSTLTGGGGNAGNAGNSTTTYQLLVGDGGAGNYKKGAPGTRSDGAAAGDSQGGNGGGDSGGKGGRGGTADGREDGSNGGLASGGGGAGEATTTQGTAGTGGDGYIEIYEWRA